MSASHGGGRLQAREAVKQFLIISAAVALTVILAAPATKVLAQTAPSAPATEQEHGAHHPDHGRGPELRTKAVVKVRINDLVSGGRVRSRAIVVHQKTGLLAVSAAPMRINSEIPMP
jgi:hypothetical protein